MFAAACFFSVPSGARLKTLVSRSGRSLVKMVKDRRPAACAPVVVVFVMRGFPTGSLRAEAVQAARLDVLGGVPAGAIAPILPACVLLHRLGSGFLPAGANFFPGFPARGQVVKGAHVQHLKR